VSFARTIFVVAGAWIVNTAILAENNPAEVTSIVLPAGTNAFDSVDARTRNCEVSVAIVQFTPRKATNDLDRLLDQASSILDVSRILNACGPVRIIYNASRELAVYPGAVALFDSSESRPAFVLRGSSERPAAPLGLKLKVTVVPDGAFKPQDNLDFAWTGNLVCSPDLLENAKWEKGLMLLFNVANGLGAGFYDEPKKKGIRQAGGINVVSLFSKKAKAEETDPVNRPKLEQELSYYKSNIEEHALIGRQSIANGSLLMKSLNTAAPGKPVYYLFLQYNVL
jgi:hypothetical protein